MNKTIIFVSFVISIIFIYLGVGIRTHVLSQKIELRQFQEDGHRMKEQITYKELLPRHKPVVLSQAYTLVMNQIRMLQAYSGTDMNVELENTKNSDDISSRYVSTVYKGIKGLKIKIIVDKFSKETDMGAVLDDIHLLEKSTDFMATEITKDNNDLIVKGEIYGL